MQSQAMFHWQKGKTIKCALGMVFNFCIKSSPFKSATISAIKEAEQQPRLFVIIHNLSAPKSTLHRNCCMIHLHPPRTQLLLADLSIMFMGSFLLYSQEFSSYFDLCHKNVPGLIYTQGLSVDLFLWHNLCLIYL